MRAINGSVLVCLVLALAGCPQGEQSGTRDVVASKAVGEGPKPSAPSQGAGSGVTLTLATGPVSASIVRGDAYMVALTGNWTNAGSGAVYVQASDSGGRFVVPAPKLAQKLPSYRLALHLPTSTPVGVHSGVLTVRACADSLCTAPYPETTHSVNYTLQVNALGEWETLQRSSRHDGYVPTTLDPTRYQVAWTWQPPGQSSVGAVVTSGDYVYFTEGGSPASVRALRIADGVSQWRRAFTGSSGSVRVNPPSVSNGTLYITTTGHGDTWLYGLAASTGLQSFQSQFSTQWAHVLNPTVRNGKVYVNAGYYGGVVYAFNVADGSPAWNASGGTYGMNTPAADDQFVYAYNGGTLNVLNAANGSLFTSIGPNPAGVQTDYNGTVMLGSEDHVLAYSGTSYYGPGNRQLLDYSVADGAVRWMSIALYSNYPAVAKGVVYATSNETYTFDALDEATGRLLWSWRPPEQPVSFIGNVVVTDNVAFVSTGTAIYAVDLRKRRAVWSAATPGTMSMSANRMLFVSNPGSTSYPPSPARITAYRLN